MRKLILVKHSLPEVLPDLPANQWRLSETGRLRCKRLAEMLAVHDPGVIVSSQEPKAVETGRILAELLGTPLELAAGLQEHDRRNVAFAADETLFQEQVGRFFEHPGELVFGGETADEAHRRFARALDRVVEQFAGINLAVVTHGTVLTLFVARAAGLQPIPLWRRLGLPAFVALSLPEFRLLEVVESAATRGPGQRYQSAAPTPTAGPLG